jgi:2,5-dihydroxypyridine 5,6-dioxygenase
MSKQQINPARIPGLFRRQLELCHVREGETVVLLTDGSTRRDYVQATQVAAEELGAYAYEIGISASPAWLHIGVDVVGKAKGMMDALCAADLICVFHPPNFTAWQKRVRAAGARVLSIADSPDVLAKLLSPPGLKEAVQHAAALWGEARHIRLVSDAGTDLSWTRGEFKVKEQYGFAESAGRFDAWGAGHITNFPDEGSANGTVVLQPGDMWILPYIRAIENPVRLEVREGFIRKVEGGLDAKAFRHWLDSNKRSADDLDPYAVSHLGVGLHPGGHWDQILRHGNSFDQLHIMARVFAGNFLFSTGPNTDMGGKRDTKGHIDAPMCDCSVLLDGNVLMDHGRFIDSKLVVPSGRATT